MSTTAGDNEHTSVLAALRAWHTKGPTSLTVALLADALHGVAEREYGGEAEVAALLAAGGVDATHGLNHAPLPAGTVLAPGFCADCDKARVSETRGGTDE